MIPDLALAVLHHLLALALATLLAAELVLLRAPMAPGTVARLLRLDAGYGLSALSLLAVGGARLAFGMRPAAYYLHNPWFWAKLGAFLLAGLLSIAPTLAFLRWRRRSRADAGFVPSPQAVLRARRVVVAELGLLAAIFALAAAMARYGTF